LGSPDALKTEFRTLPEVTFVFTDFEGSTAMSLADADAFRQLQAWTPIPNRPLLSLP
jgi:hypothetical protein